MNAETLDSLLMDRALEALTPEVDALLSAYLERDEQAAARAQEFAMATNLSRQVLQTRVPAPPPFPAATLRRAQQARRQLVLLRNVASLAACVLIGVGLGSWGTRSPVTPGAVQIVPMPATNALNVADGGARSDGDGFWSARRLYEQSRERSRARPARIEWDSPLRRPRLGGAT